jgi:FAD-dependent urate hydroxylase
MKEISRVKTSFGLCAFEQITALSPAPLIFCSKEPAPTQMAKEPRFIRSPLRVYLPQLPRLQESPINKLTLASLLESGITRFGATRENMANVETILVVGGGVAGSATAAALRRHGFTTELVERQQTWHALGAGFLVHANGMRMLRLLGLAAGVENGGAAIRRWYFCDEHGHVLSDTDLEALWGDAGPCVGIERSKLQLALLPGVADVRCRLGTSVTSLVQDGRRVSVGFSDGSTGNYDLVVGADGIDSTVRALTLTTATPSDLGAMNWRSIAPIRPGGLTALQMHLGDGCMFGLVPMGAGRTYGFAYVIQLRFRDPLEGRLDRLRNRFAHFGSRVQEYLASLERDDQVICSAMEWIELASWHIGRVVLVGDAAHASSPLMGQGGCMAMEDACVLAEELRAAATVDSALASYVKRRKSRVEWVQRQSMAVGESLNMPAAVRNTALRENGNQMMQARFGPLVPAP